MTGTALAHRHIVITRPLGQANKLKAAIEAEAGQALLFPLIAISPLEGYSAFEQVLADLPSYDWIIFISSNTVQHGMPRLIEAYNGIPSHLQFAAIGPVTAAELAGFGVQQVLIPENRFDSEALLALAPMLAVKGKKCMIVRGVGGREVLAETLKSRGAEVTFAECYQRVNPQSDTKVLQGLWQNDQLDAIVVTSSEAMRHLLDLATATDTLAWLKKTAICVNHARIAEEASVTDLNIHVAAAPGDAAMLQCLIRTLNPQHEQ